MRTVGFLLYEKGGTDGYVVLTDTLGYDECSSVHKIPSGMIINMRSLS